MRYHLGASASLSLVVLSVMGLFAASGWVQAQQQQQEPVGAPPAVLAREVVENGPPPDRPADQPGVPPADGLFYVPGEYVPDQQGQPVWRQGYWAKSVPGWSWIPARWVRLSRGWTFVEGSWQPEIRPAPADAAGAGEIAAADPGLAPVATIERQTTRAGLVLPESTLTSSTLVVYPNWAYGATWGYPGPAPFGGLWGTGFGGIGALPPIYGPTPMGYYTPFVGSISAWGGRGYFGWGRPWGYGWGGGPWGWRGGAWWW